MGRARSNNLLDLDVERRAEQAGFKIKAVRMVGRRPISDRPKGRLEPRIALGPLLQQALKTGSARS